MHIGPIFFSGICGTEAGSTGKTDLSISGLPRPVSTSNSLGLGWTNTHPTSEHTRPPPPAPPLPRPPTPIPGEAVPMVETRWISANPCACTRTCVRVSDAGQEPASTPAGTRIVGRAADQQRSGYRLRCKLRARLAATLLLLCNHHKRDRTYHGLRHRRSILAQTGTSRPRPSHKCCVGSGWCSSQQHTAASSSSSSQQPAASSSTSSQKLRQDVEHRGGGKLGGTSEGVGGGEGGGGCEPDWEEWGRTERRRRQRGRTT